MEGVKKQGSRIGYIILSLLVIGFIITAALRATAEVDQQTVAAGRFMMNTFMTIQIFYDANDLNTNQDELAALANEALDIIAALEPLLSMHMEDTDIWAINNAAGQPVNVSDVTVAVLHEAIALRELTQGYFDVTIGAVTSLWDEGIVPDSGALSLAMSTLGADIEVEGNSVRLSDPNAVIDLGAIAKGFAADHARAFLEERGVAALLNMGGDVVAIGQKPDGTDWSIGIRNPFNPLIDGDGGLPFALLFVDEGALTTSGLYERFFYYDGQTYHHIIDPRTGFPVQNNVMSVTVIIDNATMADALATALFVMGFDSGMALVESRPGLEAIFIFDDGSWAASSGVGESVGMQAILTELLP